MSSSAPCDQIEILDHTALITLEDEWNALLQRSYDNRIFSTREFLSTWWQHFGRPEACVIISRDQNRSLNAILPLQISSEADGVVLSLLGDPEVADYMDGIAIKQDAAPLLSVLWDRAFDQLSFDRIDLRHVPSSSPVLTVLAEIAEKRGWSSTTDKDEVCPIAILCNDWDGYLQLLSKKHRHEIRRKLRRAQEAAEWEWRTAHTSDEVARDIEGFLRLHEASAHDKANFMSDPMRDFFRALAQETHQKGQLRLSTFRRDGRDIAANLSFSYRNRYLLYNSGYDPEQAHHSPGIAAVALSMIDAISERAVAFDFMSGDESYKYDFGASNTYTSQAHVTQ